MSRLISVSWNGARDFIKTREKIIRDNLNGKRGLASRH
jgi:hypothetical protein